MGKFGDTARIVSCCDRQRVAMWNDFNKIKPKLTEIARYFYPTAVSSLERDVRELIGVDQYDDDDDRMRMTGVPFDAFRICVNGFYVHLTGPNTKWFKLGNPKFGRTDESQDDFFNSVYEELTDATRWLIGWSGAYKSVHAVYRHLTAFGFAALLATEDEERYVHCQTLRIGTYAMGVDRRGRVDRVCRHFAMTAEQMVEEFGWENVGDNVRTAAENRDTTTRYEVWNLIEPHRKVHDDEGPYNLSYQRFAYRSVYWSGDSRSTNDGVLAVRGYAFKPIVCPRINHEEGDIYGRGLCADVLGHARALQTMREDCLDIDDQNAHPSMMAPASMSDDGLHLDPLSVNWYPDGAGKDAVYRTIQAGLDTEGTRADAGIAEMELRKALLNSEFETINAMEDSRPGRDRMTATEVSVRVDEKMEQLSGIATTLNDEWLDPFVTMMSAFVKLASVRAAAGERTTLPAIIDLPEEVMNARVPFDIKYESKIHAAANAQTVNAGFESLSRAGSFAEAKPEILDNFDLDAIARDTHRMLGAPENWLKTTKLRDEERRAREEAAQQARQAQQAALNAKTLRDVASSPISPETLGGAIATAGQEGEI